MTIQEKYTKHILAFLEERPYISISTLEKKVGLYSTTIAKAKNGSRLIPLDAIYNLLCELAKCGMKDIHGYRLTYLPDIDCIAGAKHNREYMTVEVLTMKDGTERTRQVTDEMHQDDWEDPHNGQIASSRFDYYVIEDRILYSNSGDL